MTYQEDALRHLRKAEERDAFVNKMEDWADRKVTQENGARLAKMPQAAEQRMRAELVRNELKDDVLYSVRGKSRDYHIRMSTMYSVYALVEAMQPTVDRAGPNPWPPVGLP